VSFANFVVRKNQPQDHCPGFNGEATNQPSIFEPTTVKPVGCALPFPAIRYLLCEEDS
jgi:hypothetical protein